MNEKYLPIGTVCTLKGKNKKVMITGFYSVEFNGNLKINDYSGCVYPEGLLLPESNYSFNHSDIDRVEFLGYCNDEYKKFNSLLNRLNINEDENSLSSNKSYSKILFDENGVVILAEPIKQEPKEKEIKFDENGYVIAVEEVNVKNPFYKDYKEIKKNDNLINEDNIFYKDDMQSNNVEFNQMKNNSLNEIKLDTNGDIVPNKENLLEQKNENYQYWFDDKGYLIAVDKKEEKNIITTNYKFDEEGNLVSQQSYKFDSLGNLVSMDNLDTKEEIEFNKNRTTTNYKFDSEGNVISQQSYEFDSLGNLVSMDNSDNDSEILMEVNSSKISDSEEIVSNDVSNNEITTVSEEIDELDDEDNIILPNSDIETKKNKDKVSKKAEKKTNKHSSSETTKRNKELITNE